MMDPLFWPSKLVGMSEPALSEYVGNPMATCSYGLSSSLGLGSVVVPSCTGSEVTEEMLISELVVSGFSFSQRTSGSLDFFVFEQSYVLVDGARIGKQVRG